MLSQRHILRCKSIAWSAALLAASLFVSTSVARAGSPEFSDTRTIIVDNASPQFTASSNWATSTGGADKYGPDYRWRPTAAITDDAIWYFNITIAGNYGIYAWWSAGTNRTRSASFILPDNTTVIANQQVNGGKWNLLGVKYLPVGISTVKLSCWAPTGYIVVADAVKVVRQ